MVQVEQIDDTTYEVTVQGPPTTTHRVTVRPEYYQKLTGGRVSPERLVERSFDFLLQRESNRSILASFDLSVIQRYFPAYESTIGGMLEGD
jgi:hypothetical protein